MRTIVERLAPSFGVTMLSPMTGTAIVFALSGGAILVAPAFADEPSAAMSPRSVTKSMTIQQLGETVDLTLDFAKILTLGRTAKTVVIGNPGILDATITDERTIVLTGKSAGTTNLIILDAAAKEVANLIVNVVPGRHVMTVYHGTRRQTFSCISGCKPVLSVGDDNQHFDTTRAQIQGRQEFMAGQSR